MKKDNVKNQLYYFWSFYKWIIVAVVIVAALLIYFVAAMLTEKESVLNVMLMDCHSSVSDEQMNEDFASFIHLAPEKYSVSIQSSLMIGQEEGGSYTMSCLAKFLAEAGNENLDVCGMLESDFRKYDNADTWLALSDCFTDEELSTLTDGLYRDGDGRIIGLYADALPVLSEYGCYGSGDSRGIIGIVYNTHRRDTAVKYLRYLAGFEKQ